MLAHTKQCEVPIKLKVASIANIPVEQATLVI